MKITPAHDPNDFEVGRRHNLPEINIMNDDATINSLGGKYAGMDRYEARKAMVQDLEEMGLLVKVVPHSHSVGTHDRCGTTVEPMIKPQWFVKMGEMAKEAIKALEQEIWNLCPSVLTKPIFTGWKTSVTGVFPDSSGGDTDPGLLLRGVRRGCGCGGNAGEMPEMRLHSFPSGRGYSGYLVFLLLCGSSPRWAGRKNTGTGIFLSHRRAGDRL